MAQTSKRPKTDANDVVDDARSRHRTCQKGLVKQRITGEGRPYTIGVDLAKNVFQVHGVDNAGKGVLEDIERNWGSPHSLSIEMRTAGAGEDPLRAERIAAYFRASASPGAAAAIMRMNRDIDVRHILSATHVPTLVIHRTGDPVIEVGHGRYLAQHITGAKLIKFDEALHMPWLGNRDAILDAVEQFLTGGQRVQEPDRLLATVLFADIVGSTEHVAAMGDNPWRELLKEFYAQVREVLERYRGREINTAGDGFLATFDGPARAIRCANALGGALRPLGLKVRCGIHTGECEFVGRDLAGIAVHIGARVANLATPGECSSRRPSAILLRAQAWRSRIGDRID